MKFGLQAAYVGVVAEPTRAWIRDRLDEIAPALRVGPSAVFCGLEMDPFAYLRE